MLVQTQQAAADPWAGIPPNMRALVPRPEDFGRQGESLDWSKVVDPRERTRLQNIVARKRAATAVPAPTAPVAPGPMAINPLLALAEVAAVAPRAPIPSRVSSEGKSISCLS